MTTLTSAAPDADRAADAVSEIPYADYVVHQLERASSEGVRADIARIRPSGHFRHREHRWSVAPYRGYAFVSMLSASPDNEVAVNLLASQRHELATFAPGRPAVCPLASESFHQTFANTLSGERLPDALSQLEVAEQDFQHALATALRDLPPLDTDAPLVMRLVGISVFGSSLGALSVFDDPDAHARVLRFRDLIYSHPALVRFGVRRTRPFIGHVTLGYFDRPLDAEEREPFAALLDQLNRAYAAAPVTVTFARAEARLFHDLSAFKVVPDMPVCPL